MKSAMSVRPRTSSTLTSKAFMSAKASITTVLSDGLALVTLRLSAGLGLLAALGLPAVWGLTTALSRAFILLLEVFLTGTTLSVVWNKIGYPGLVYALHPA